MHNFRSHLERDNTLGRYYLHNPQFRSIALWANQVNAKDLARKRNEMWRGGKCDAIYDNSCYHRALHGHLALGHIGALRWQIGQLPGKNLPFRHSKHKTLGLSGIAFQYLGAVTKRLEFQP